VSRQKVIVGMSGGVDSSVAAWLLKDQGFEVIGLFMKNWEDDDTDEYCTSREDLVDAVSVADCIGIDIEAVNFSAEYRERVFENFLSEYRKGRTPNPDVLCNAEIKFKAFLEHALNLGADWIATGHYARIRRPDRHLTGDSSCELLRAADPSKDQSYFLYRLNQTQLSRTLFPLGDWLKRDVRRLARELGLPNHDKRDSTGICFIGERPFREFLMRYLPTSPGVAQAPDGRVVGQHQGLMYYTIGQRHGLGIGGPGEPWYVVGKDLERNRLMVAQGREHPALFKDRLEGTSASWIVGTAPRVGQSYTAKTRYRQPDTPCSLVRAEAQTCELNFSDPQWAITPGQSVVLYDGEVCLGGSIIC
jgi:tRNA-uridine 2-sulfurtransferase